MVVMVAGAGRAGRRGERRPAPDHLAVQPDTRVNQDAGTAGQQETTLAVNPLNPDNAVVVYKDYRAAERNYLAATTDGGLTWREQPFPDLGPTAPGNTDPSVYFRRDGRAYILWTARHRLAERRPLLRLVGRRRRLPGALRARSRRPAGITTIAPWLAFDATGGPRNGAIYVAWSPLRQCGDLGRPLHRWRRLLERARARQSTAPRSATTTARSCSSCPTARPWSSSSIDAIAGQTSALVSARSTDGGPTFAPNTPLLTVQQPPFNLPGEHWRHLHLPQPGLRPRHAAGSRWSGAITATARPTASIS